MNLNSEYYDPYEVARAWPRTKPLWFLAGTGRYCILLTDFKEIGDIGGRRFQARAHKTSNVPSPTLVGILGYDDSPNRYFEVNGAWVFDQHGRKLWSIGNAGPCPAPHVTVVGEAGGVTLRPNRSDQEYLAMVGNALEDIASGRYYQINLLRYFTIEGRPDRNWALSRMERWGGPYSAYIDVSGLEIVSLSPERFVEVKAEVEGLVARTFPIKGTARRVAGRAADALQIKSLDRSRKNRAELSMIVDLMRNDFHRICARGSVVVEDPGSVRSFSAVHHLVGAVRGRLHDEVTFSAFLQALCPGGSITGAPKVEVMRAIRSYEGRSRGYFMGHVFIWDEAHGTFDSSILIRSMVRHGNGNFEAAVGSGIVIQSEALDELREIDAKARVFSAAATRPHPSLRSGLGLNL